MFGNFVSIDKIKRSLIQTGQDCQVKSITGITDNEKKVLENHFDFTRNPQNTIGTAYFIKDCGHDMPSMILHESTRVLYFGMDIEDALFILER